MKRIVITGMGAITPLGNSVSEATSAAFDGVNGIRRCDHLLGEAHGDGLASRVAGTVEDFDAAAHIPEWLGDWYDRGTAYALAATAEALADAAIDFDDALLDRTGVLIGASAPGNHLYHRVGQQLFAGEGWRGLPGRLAPQLSGNIYSAMLAQKYGFRGPTYCIVNACATGATSLGAAADAIRCGRADVVIAGGTDAVIGPILFGSMGNARAMNPTDDPRAASRPFDADRSGLVAGEGAGVFIVESAEHAAARGARVHAELLGDAQTNDAAGIYRPDLSGESWARTMRLAMLAAGVEPDDIDVISAHAPSTKLGDRTETLAIKAALGGRARDVPVSATKSMHGHLYGAAGAVETVLALAAMARDEILPTMHLTRPDPECDLDYVPNKGRHARTRVLLKNSFGFGGTNACLVLKAA